MSLQKTHNYTPEWRYLRRLEEGIGSPGSGFTGSCKQGDVALGAASQPLCPWVLPVPLGVPCALGCPLYPLVLYPQTLSYMHGIH